MKGPRSLGSVDPAFGGPCFRADSAITQKGSPAIALMKVSQIRLDPATRMGGTNPLGFRGIVEVQI